VFFVDDSFGGFIIGNHLNRHRQTVQEVFLVYFGIFPADFRAYSVTLQASALVLWAPAQPCRSMKHCKRFDQESRLPYSTFIDTHGLGFI